MKQPLVAVTLVSASLTILVGQTPRLRGSPWTRPLLASFFAGVVFQKKQPPNLTWKNQGVLYLDHSLNARFHPVPIQAVHLDDSFWGARLKVITGRALPTILQSLEEHGVIDNFRRLSVRPDLPRRGPVYADASLYEWIESAAWALANDTPDPEKQSLRSEIDSFVSYMATAQDPTGYLNTYFTGEKARLRLTDLLHSDEDYCLAALLEAGIAYYRAAGERRLLDVGIRFADYLVDNFGPSKRPFATGYPGLEMALVELYRTTGQAKYLEFARYLFSGVERDRLKWKDSDVRYTFSGKPFTSRTELEGHTVRALNAAAGATDYFTETGDPAFKRTLDLLWTDLTMRKMYLNGSAGSRGGDESFGEAYDLPADETNAETCATVANAMWNFRLLALTGDGRYAEVLERALYNGVNAGVSLSGNLFSSRDPLASTGEKLRNSWSESTCSAPDITRLLEALPGYLYGISRDGVYLNLYQDSELDWRLQDGTSLKLIQTTSYPWTGQVSLKVIPARRTDFTIYIRWPAWASGIDIQVQGQPVGVSSNQRGTFVPLSRAWKPGDTVIVKFPIQSTPTLANPRVAGLYGRAALQRGPLVYAAEQTDQSGAPLSDVFVRLGGPISTDPRKDLLGGVTILKLAGQVAEKTLSAEPLYEPLPGSVDRAKRPITVTFVPYYTVGNRESTPMEVWLPISKVDVSRSAAAAPALEKNPEMKHLQ